MTVPCKELFSTLLHINYLVKYPNWQEGWAEGYLHQMMCKTKDQTCLNP